MSDCTKLMNFIDGYDEHDSHKMSLYDPFKLLEASEFTHQSAAGFIELALETKIEYLHPKKEFGSRMRAIKYLKEFRNNEQFRAITCDLFNERALQIYEQAK